MFGTVAQMHVKPGMDDALRAFIARTEARTIPGSVAFYVYRMDKDPNEYLLAAVFESREAYMANADSSEQNTEYEEMLTFLAGPPEWHDGEIVYSGGPQQ